jgi:pimeloyl-ACP methyl ester carboxylesterase
MSEFPSAKRVTVSPEGADEQITLSVHEVSSASGQGCPAVVFCHGFPDLAYGWRNQLGAVAATGFRAIAPDQRGYGASSAPDSVDAYGLTELTGDLVGMLDALEIERAFFVGHDWGGFVAWAMPVLHPDRVLGVAGLCTPYMPFPSVARHLEAVGGDVDRQYVAWFQEPGLAETEMDLNVRTILERILRTGVPLEEAIRHAISDGKLNMNPFRNSQAWPILGDALGSPADLDHYCSAYTNSGFRGGVNWYRNGDRNLVEHPGISQEKLDIPCLMLTAEWDPGLRPEFAAGMDALCSDLEIHLIEKAGHWIQQEAHRQVTEYLIGWLKKSTA